MQFSVFALLISSTQAATALVAPTACNDKPVNDAFTAGMKTVVTAAALVKAAKACTTSLALVDEYNKGVMIENAMWAPNAVKLTATKATAAELTSFYTAMDEFSAALGMGKLSCAAGVTCTTPKRVLLKGSLAVQELAMNAATDYFVAQRAFCAKTAATAAACNTAGLKGLKPMGTSYAAADVYSKKTAAERTTFITAEDKKNVAAALAAIAPAAGAVGASCKAAAAVAPATVGVRPTCGAANCCMGIKKTAEGTTNTDETCQLKATTKPKVITTAASAKATGNYVEVTVAVEEEQIGACIEGAIRNASAALSVLAAAYMMA
jgi:hypothetical protein